MQSLMVLLLELFTCSLSMVLDVYCKIVLAIAIILDHGPKESW